MDKRLLKNLDWWIILITLAIVVFGCVAIYSASSLKTVVRQIIWVVIGLFAAVGISSIDQQFYVRNAKRLYFWMMVALIVVAKFGETSKGAQRWIDLGGFQIQPSEFSKIIIIVCLAAFLSHFRNEIKTFNTFVRSFVYLLLPMGLIFLQPDLGTALVVVSIWLTMSFVAGTDYKNILIFLGVGVVLFVVAWFVPGVLKDYQKMRVVNTFNPGADPLGSGYHVTQSRIAIGSGQLSGKGYGSGTQRKLSFIPEQHTDFIFTVVGEEFGFVGGSALILLYFFLILRTLLIAAAAEDFTGRAIAAGIAGMFSFHVVVNLGMTLGIMPVTGVPLPLFSYGGSSMVTNLTAIGLLEGVAMRRHHINF